MHSSLSVPGPWGELGVRQLTWDCCVMCPQLLKTRYGFNCPDVVRLHLKHWCLSYSLKTFESLSGVKLGYWFGSGIERFTPFCSFLFPSCKTLDILMKAVFTSGTSVLWSYSGSYFCCCRTLQRSSWSATWGNWMRTISAQSWRRRAEPTMTLRPSREVPRSTGRVGVRGVGLGSYRGWGGVGWGGVVWNNWGQGSVGGRAATSWGEGEAGWRGQVTKVKSTH